MNKNPNNDIIMPNMNTPKNLPKMKYLPESRRSTDVVPKPNNMQIKALLKEIPTTNAGNNSSITSPPHHRRY